MSASAGPFAIGVDIAGIFTDVVLNATAPGSGSSADIRDGMMNLDAARAIYRHTAS